MVIGLGRCGDRSQSSTWQYHRLDRKLPTLRLTPAAKSYLRPLHTLAIMSWQTYVDVNLLGSGKVSHAAILGLKGGVWATSSGFALSPEEQKAIVGTFDNPSTALANGVRAAGRKYLTLRADDRIIYGKLGVRMQVEPSLTR